MIKECNDSDKSLLLDYIGKDYGKCLYVYIDLRKYPLDNHHFRAWCQYDDQQTLVAVVTEYHKGIQVYSKSQDFNAEEIASFLNAKNPPIILGMKETMDKLWPFMPERKQELGTVGQLTSVRIDANPNAYAADYNELEDIVNLLVQDENIGKPYGFESLYTQFRERMEDGFGRNYILRDNATHELICHAGTYAELPEIAVIGGVITSPNFRGQGQAKSVLAALCQKLLEEGKDIFSFYYIPPAIKMHLGVGFESIGEWAKLIPSAN